MLNENGRVDLSNYGYLLETYLYNIDSSTGDPQEITYASYNTDGEAISDVYVSRDKDEGRVYRQVIFWNGYGPNIDGILRDPILNMELDLETIDPDFSLDKVEFYTIDDAGRVPNIVDLGRDDYGRVYGIVIPGHSGVYEGDKDITIQIFDSSRVAYYKNQNIYRVYPMNDEHCIEEIIVLYNCVVEKDFVDHTITVSYYDGDVEEFSYPQFTGNKEYQKYYTGSKIDMLTDCNYCRLDLSYKEKEDTHIAYEYDSEGMTTFVTKYKALPEEDAKYDKSTGEGISRSEDYGNNLVYPNEGPYKREEFAAVYPTGVTKNNYNFSYKYGKLWTMERANYDNEGMYILSREIYVIRDNAIKELYEDIHSYDDDPILLI